jgi:predicted enzyme related to lactoylglutathione lyase
MTTNMDMIVNIDVDDLDKAILFYETALGLRVNRLLFEGSVAEMTGASSPIYLLLKPAGATAVDSPPVPRKYERHWTPIHLDFVVQDLHDAVTRVIEAGGTLEGEIRGYAWGCLATFCDPFGHGFCVLQFSADGYGAIP